MDWNPLQKGKLMGFDAEKGKNEIFDIQQAKKTEQCTSSYVPKWLYKRGGVSFGFGGKLLSFGAQSETIKIHKVTSNARLVDEVKKFDSESQERHAEENIDDYISQTEASVADCSRTGADTRELEQERLEWTLLKCIATKSYTKIYEEFGADAEQALAEGNKFTGKKAQQTTAAKPKPVVKTEDLDASGGEEFFNQMIQNQHQKKQEQV